MTVQPCPADAVFAQLIAGTVPADERKIEAHLTECDSCRQRIDSLAEVSAISTIIGSTLVSPPTESLYLRRAIERLLIESQMQTQSSNLQPKTIRDVLPVLQPTARPGFIGRLGEIDVRKVIGRGGMGVVYEGVDVTLNRTVAIKVLSPHLVSNAAAKARFLREAQAAASLTHENIVTIHAIDEANAMQYLVLQFVSGESLADRLQREEKLPFSDVVRIGIQTAKGLAAAHAHGLVHRDIKPANLLLEATTGDVRIADFGLAKHASSDSITVAGTIMGTPMYMSPEQSVDGDVDARSDLFSFGVVLYEASTGISPFANDSSFVVLDKIRNHNPRLVCEVNPELPIWFSTIVQRLLEKKPEKRICSASELAQLLEQELSVAPAQSLAAVGSRRFFLGLTVTGVAGLSIASALYFRRGEVPASLPSIKGFIVDGIAEPFTTLADAIQAASDNGVIDVHGDGPYPTPTIVIEGKRLTIRAAPGATPRFVPDGIGENEIPQFLNSNVDLRLEGLEVIWPIPSPQDNLDEFARRCVVGSTSGKLTLSYCRVVAGPFGVCVAAANGDVVAEHSHLISVSGVCLAWRSTVTSVRVEQCFLEGNIALITTTSAAETAPTRIHFAFNTVYAQRVLNLIVKPPVRISMVFTANHNLIDSQVIVALYSFLGFLQGPNANARMTEMLHNAMSWKDESNVYRKGSLYLAGNPRQQRQSTLPSDLKGLGNWLEFWQQPASKSIEGTIRFAERTGPIETTVLQLKSIEDPSSPIPPDFGANPLKIGPGQANNAHHSASEPER